MVSVAASVTLATVSVVLVVMVVMVAAVAMSLLVAMPHMFFSEVSISTIRYSTINPCVGSLTCHGIDTR